MLSCRDTNLHLKTENVHTLLLVDLELDIQVHSHDDQIASYVNRAHNIQHIRVIESNLLAGLHHESTPLLLAMILPCDCFNVATHRMMTMLVTCGLNPLKPAILRVGAPQSLKSSMYAGGEKKICRVSTATGELMYVEAAVEEKIADGGRKTWWKWWNRGLDAERCSDRKIWGALLLTR